MDIPSKKLNNGFEMPVLGLGTYGMGGGYRERATDAYDEMETLTIRQALDLGVTHIDTAEMYAGGECEKLVGQAIKNYNREKIFLVSKAWPETFGYKEVINSCEQSLHRLNTSYLNLYLLHRYPGSNDALAGSIKALLELRKKGQILYPGISNFNLEHTKQAQIASNNQIAATQVHHSLKFREPEVSGVLDYCQKNNIMLIAWRPLGLGTLKNGKINLENVELLKQFSDKYQKTPRQIALNWLISQTNVVTLTKTSSPEHLKENLGSLSWQMETEDIELLRQQYPEQQFVSDSVPLG